jgi:hypothetical protein
MSDYVGRRTTNFDQMANYTPCTSGANCQSWKIGVDGNVYAVRLDGSSFLFMGCSWTSADGATCQDGNGNSMHISPLGIQFGGSSPIIWSN